MKIKRKVYEQRILGKRNQLLRFSSLRKRNEYLKQIIPLEVEQNFEGTPNTNKPDYPLILQAMQTLYGSLTLPNGTTLYIKNDKELLLLKVLYQSQSPDNIAMDCKREFEKCSCDDCVIKLNDIHNVEKEKENV
tara:strand:+ start:1558 stop:1959 length:402 start_codon:yes stop_codon:yes gene_type:complete